MEKIYRCILNMQKSNTASHHTPPHPPKLDDFDIAALRFLQALLDTSAITRAGELLGLSQPAASRAMQRLRQHFADPLLVRTAKGYALTPVAELLRPAVRTALDGINALFEVATFDARTATRSFRIASTDYGLSVALLPQCTRLRTAAPGITWQTEPWSDETLAKLERGELDCAFYADEPLPPDFHYRSLFSDGYALVCRQQHPLAALPKVAYRTLLKEAAKHPLWLPRYISSRRYLTDNIYAQFGLPAPCIAMASPYFYNALQCVLDNDWVAVVPERLARIWTTQHAIAVLPIAEKSLRFGYRLIWHARAHRDTGLQWLREQLAHGSF
jgi:DNA-binding transcriptional LysR family regulator